MISATPLNFTEPGLRTRTRSQEGAVRTCSSLSGQGGAHAAGVLSHDFNVVGGSGLQVVQSVGGNVAHEEVGGLIRACRHKTESWFRSRSKIQN